MLSLENGAVRSGVVPLRAGYVTGADLITWLEVVDPTEALEIYPDPALLRRVGGGSFEVSPALAVRDGTFFAKAARLRQVHRSGQVPTDIEASTMVHQVVAHLIASYGHAEPPPESVTFRPGRLSQRAVETVAE